MRKPSAPILSAKNHIGYLFAPTLLAVCFARPSIHEARDKWQKGSLSIEVLGLVTTRTPQFEKKDDLRRRIDEATKFAPLAQLALSPQCGFTSIILGNRVTHDEQRRKLELVVETARDAWGE